MFFSTHFKFMPTLSMTLHESKRKKIHKKKRIDKKYLKKYGFTTVMKPLYTAFVDVRKMEIFAHPFVVEILRLYFEENIKHKDIDKVVLIYENAANRHSPHTFCDQTHNNTSNKESPYYTVYNQNRFFEPHVINNKNFVF